MRRLVPLTAVILLASSLNAQAAKHTKDTLDDVKKNMKGGKALLVDVREVDEWNEGHLAAAELYQLSVIKEKEPSAEELKKRFGDKKIIYLHCQAGGRCLTAADVLKGKGYDIRPLKQGYPVLLKNGFKKAEEKKEK